MIALLALVCIVRVAAASPVCPAETTGYLCDVSMPAKYYECNSPWYVGWRDCPSGTTCLDSSRLHSAIPCSLSNEEEKPKPETDLDFTNTNNTTGGNTNNEADYELDWGTWWIWTVFGVFVLFSFIVAWIGAVTWPDAHESIAVLSKGYCC